MADIETVSPGKGSCRRSRPCFFSVLSESFFGRDGERICKFLQWRNEIVSKQGKEVVPLYQPKS